MKKIIFVLMSVLTLVVFTGCDKGEYADRPIKGSWIGTKESWRFKANGTGYVTHYSTYEKFKYTLTDPCYFTLYFEGGYKRTCSYSIKNDVLKLSGYSYTHKTEYTRSSKNLSTSGLRHEERDPKATYVEM